MKLNTSSEFAKITLFTLQLPHYDTFPSHQMYFHHVLFFVCYQALLPRS